MKYYIVYEGARLYQNSIGQLCFLSKNYVATEFNSYDEAQEAIKKYFSKHIKQEYAADDVEYKIYSKDEWVIKKIIE